MIDLPNARWFKSSGSPNADTCVEVAFLAAGRVGVRDSTDPAGPALVFTGEQWDRFIAGVRVAPRRTE
ncbi:DUF397 domain-containing protein [Nocardia sp. 2]|uniref:DUF397 domain-containing protein n=1 Tax=Nocardia acididurans TaxID=2802282 RepID=A0ABS1MGS2_9NOCA|nr:DUF397 domain-containing protein [Nocardia acididurans]MBL1079865.1 DUF397 domain-containing protein [Nocardia acididurans]